MKQADREKIFDALMKGVPRDDQIEMEIGEMISHDIDAIEPIIDEIEKEAYERGKAASQ